MLKCFIMSLFLVLVSSCGKTPKESDPNNYNNRIEGTNFPVDLGNGIGGCSYCSSTGKWVIAYDINGSSVKGVFSGEWGNYSFTSGSVNDDVINARLQFPEPLGVFQIDDLRLVFSKSTPQGETVVIQYESFSMGGPIDNGITSGVVKKTTYEAPPEDDSDGDEDPDDE